MFPTDGRVVIMQRTDVTTNAGLRSLDPTNGLDYTATDEDNAHTATKKCIARSVNHSEGPG